MARPRTEDVDIIQTVFFTYVLKTAINRALAITGETSSAVFIRRRMEEACQKSLGPDKWARLQAGATREARRELLDRFLVHVDVTRIRRLIDAASPEMAASERMGKIILREINTYLAEFLKAREAPDTDLAVCVALEEAIDVVRKIRILFSSTKPRPDARHNLKRLTPRLPISLRADLDAAILHFRG